MCKFEISTNNILHLVTEDAGNILALVIWGKKGLSFWETSPGITGQYEPYVEEWNNPEFPEEVIDVITSRSWEIEYLVIERSRGDIIEIRFTDTEWPYERSYSL